MTVEMLDEAEVFDGDRFVRRGRRRPPLDVRKEQINVRPDPDVLERLLASRPGWQTRINDGLALLTGIDRRLWNWIETQIELLERTVRQMEEGTLRSHGRDGDTTHECLKRNRQGIESLVEGNRIMRQTRMDLLRPYNAVAADEHSGRLPRATDRYDPTIRQPPRPGAGEVPPLERPPTAAPDPEPPARVHDTIS